MCVLCAAAGAPTGGDDSTVRGARARRLVQGDHNADLLLRPPSPTPSLTFARVLLQKFIQQKRVATAPQLGRDGVGRPAQEEEDEEEEEVDDHPPQNLEHLAEK